MLKNRLVRAKLITQEQNYGCSGCSIRVDRGCANCAQFGRASHSNTKFLLDQARNQLDSGRSSTTKRAKTSVLQGGTEEVHERESDYVSTHVDGSNSKFLTYTYLWVCRSFQAMDTSEQDLLQRHITNCTFIHVNFFIFPPVYHRHTLMSIALVAIGSGI